VQSKSLPTPKCPSCDYDLTGNDSNHAGKITCPECAATLFELETIQPESRYGLIKGWILCNLCLPIFFSGINWAVFVSADWFHSESLRKTAHNLMSLQMIYLFVLPVVLCVAEIGHRKNHTNRSIRPSIWVSLLIILFIAFISSLIWLGFATIWTPN
tara:strand:- start:447 stop:917 length:471 start_codon:yes stop_codon:yes gene_type:complete